MLTGLLITVLVVATLATAVGGGIVLAQRKRQLGGSNLKALPSGDGDKLLSRTIADLRVGDVISRDGRDYLVEGLLAYDEDGHRWNAGRMIDGDDVHWLVVGMERSGSFIIRLMDDLDLDIDGYPPETLLVGDTRYNQDKRGSATVTMKGETGLGRPRSDGLETAERVRWWLYDTAGDDSLIVEQWGDTFRVVRGSRIARDTIEMMPGS